MTPSPPWQVPRSHGSMRWRAFILRDPERGKDATQEALVRAWRDLPALRHPERFDAWLHRLLVNACMDEARRNRRHTFEVELTPIDHPTIRDSAISVDERDALERTFDAWTRSSAP